MARNFSEDKFERFTKSDNKKEYSGKESFKKKEKHKLLREKRKQRQAQWG